MASTWNKNSSYGAALLNMVQAQVPAFGNILIVMNSSNSDEKNYNHMQDIFTHDSDGNVRFFTTLESAYAAAESNNNDVICLDANSSHALVAGIAWTKNRVNVIGFDGGGRLVQQGVKVGSSATDDTGYVIKNTGVRNSFRNIKFIQNSTDAAALSVLQFGGEGNLYENCSATFGVADNLDQTNCQEVVNGEDSGTFINCQFGQDTLLSSATSRSIMLIDQVTSGQPFKSNIFKDCTWLGSSSDADLQCISMAAAGDILFTNHFIRPSFIASISTGAGSIQGTKAVSTANGTTNGTILISYPMVHGFADIGVNGTNNDSLYVFSHVPSAVDITSVQPTTT